MVLFNVGARFPSSLRCFSMSQKSSRGRLNQQQTIWNPSCVNPEARKHFFVCIKATEALFTQTRWFWRDFVQGHAEAVQRRMGHVDFHTFPNPRVIESDRRWVTASILSGSTQVDNDFSIISVAGPDQRPPGAAITLQAHQAEPSQRGRAKLKSFGCLSGGGRLFGRWLTAVLWSYLLFLRNAGSQWMMCKIYFHSSVVNERKREGPVLFIIRVRVIYYFSSYCQGFSIYSKSLYLSLEEANTVQRGLLINCIHM